MIDTDTFLLLGTVAVSLAGFASLLFSMRSEAPSRLFAWRVRLHRDRGPFDGHRQFRRGRDLPVHR